MSESRTTGLHHRLRLTGDPDSAQGGDPAGALGLDTERARGFLATSNDPAIALQVALTLDRRDTGDPLVAGLRRRLYDAPPIRRIVDGQRADGTWGDRPDAERRIPPTVWMVKILTELGLTTEHRALAAALDHLGEHAILDGGVSIDGRREGVLSCYTGILADVLLRAGRPEAAAGPLNWIRAYQQVRYGGHDFLGADGDGAGRPIWGGYLATRYGGCMASTTCMIGLVKCGLALTRARSLGAGEPADETIGAIRDLLAERELFRRRDGSVIPIGARRDATGDAAERWLGPAFPLSYQTDLIEVATLAAQAGVPVERIDPALRRIAAWRRPDGTWPMLRRCSAGTWYQPERPSTVRGSHWITLRVLLLHQTLQDRTIGSDTSP